MRRFLSLLLFLSLSASADVVAGRNLILFHDAWSPPAGGALAPIGVPAKSAAFDGERFLVAWREGDVVWLALFDEGATVPWTRTSLDVPGTSKPFVRWNGSFYVLVVEGDPTYVARVTPQGVIETFATLGNAKSIVDVAASPFGIALLTRYTTTAQMAVDVLLLDTALAVTARTTVGSIAASIGGGTTYLDTPHIAPFGNGFYAAWREGRSLRYDNVVGTRVLLDGSAPDVEPSTREPNSLTGTFLTNDLPNPFDIELHPYGPRMAVVAIRQWGIGITATFVEPDGRATPTGYRVATGMFDPSKVWKSVRLPSGAIVVMDAKNGQTFVKPLMKAPTGRRRAV